MTSILNLSAFSGSSVFSASDDKWYENVSYEDSKDLIREKMHTAKASLVSIGFYLKHIKDKELYKEDGYSSIHEFAQSEFGFSDNTTNRYMQLNDQFSIGGNSPEIEEKYSNYNMSQLFEMLPMKEEDRQDITPDMTVKEIRKAKKQKKLVDDDSSETRSASAEEIKEYNEILDNVKAPDPVVEGLTDKPDFTVIIDASEKYEEVSDLTDEDLLDELIRKQESLLKDMKEAFSDSDIRVRRQTILVNALHSYEL